jgi:hypothetical protein
MRVLFVTTIFLAATPIAIGAASQVPQFPKDQPYAKARKLLVKKGWKPVHEPEPGFVCTKDDPRCKGARKRLLAPERGTPIVYFAGKARAS